MSRNEMGKEKESQRWAKRVKNEKSRNENQQGVSLVRDKCFLLCWGLCAC